jgi:maltose O-acetyltransferase
MKRFFRKCGKMVIVLPVMVKAILLYKIFGIDCLSNFISRLPKKIAVIVLVQFGARIGKETNISTAIMIDNAVMGNYSNLVIGDNCYIGKNVFFDLVEPVIIGNGSVISARVTFLTHSDPGERPLRSYFERKTGKIRVENGAWIGGSATIMPGVTIGECAVVGANALVNKDIPPYSVAVGVPARVIRKINE